MGKKASTCLELGDVGGNSEKEDGYDMHWRRVSCLLRAKISVTNDGGWEKGKRKRVKNNRKGWGEKAEQEKIVSHEGVGIDRTPERTEVKIT